MKSALLATALLLGTAATAQTYTTTTTTTSATSQTVAPSNANPERDARGIPVISDPATAPAGFNQAPGMNGVGGPMVDASTPPAPQPSDASYPACTRTVTDNCLQTYERGRSPTR
jgi:translation initiation factor IF-2/pilus assembly protein FimV